VRFPAGCSLPREVAARHDRCIFVATMTAALIPRSFLVPGATLALLVVAALPGCRPCNRSGCDAVTNPVKSASISRGIAGVVAAESDVVADGCQECPFSMSQLDVWAVANPVSDASAAAAVVKGQPATLTLPVDSRYERALEPGHYLVCGQARAPAECAAISVGDKGVFTVNVEAHYGPTRLVVFEPGSDTRRTTGVFQVARLD
jgi:hypothetical protein